MTALLRLVVLVVGGALSAFILLPGLRPLMLPLDVVQGLEKSPTLGLFLGASPFMAYSAGGLLLVTTLFVVITLGGREKKRHRRYDEAPGRSNSNVPAAPKVVEIKPGQKPSKKLAKQYMEAGRFKEASDVYKQLGDLHGLIDALARDGLVVEAAELMAGEGKTRQAAEMLEDSNLPAAQVKAAEMWRTLNNPERAATCLRTGASLYAGKGEGDRSVDLLLRAGEREAAREYLQPAAEAYARAGKHARAAEMFETFGMEAQAASAFEYDGTSNPDEREKRQSVVRAAKLYAKLNDFQSCGRVLEQSGLQEKAAEAYVRAQAWEDAARCFQAMGRPEKAAEILIQNGQGRKAVEFLESTGDMAAAADAAFAAGDMVRAAQLYDDTGNTAGAYKAHVASGNYGTAAEIALQRNQPADAAELFERAGNFKRAAEVLEGMGNRLKAGEYFAKAGDPIGAARMLLAEGKVKEAAALLAGVAKPEAVEAQLETTRKLTMTGDLKGAVGFLKACVDARPAADSIALSLELSSLMEAAGDIPNALAYAQRVLGVKKDHAQALMRVQQLFMRINNEQMKAAYEAAMMQQMASQASLSAHKRIVEAPAKKASDEMPRYLPEGEVGRGAMGVVYKARDTVLNRMVALKRLPEAVASDPHARASFLEEARAAAGLNHPSIVTVYDAGVEKGLPFLAMELVEGTTLSALLTQRGPLPPALALNYCATIAGALEHAHQAGIVHRDVKPGNILMGRDGRVKLTDFGIAAAVQGQGPQGVAGTPYYMAPEQILQGPLDGRADIYALGCVLVALLTGQPPYTGQDVLQRHISDPPPRPSVLRPGLPVELDALLARMMAKNPDDRFPSGGACALALSELESRLRVTQPLP